jgi:hypothetical protein
VTNRPDSDSLLRHTRTHACANGEPTPPELTAVVSPARSHFGRNSAPGIAEDRPLPGESTEVLESISITAAPYTPALRTSLTDSAATTIYAAYNGHQPPSAGLGSRFVHDPAAGIMAESTGASRPISTDLAGVPLSIMDLPADLSYLDIELAPNESTCLLGDDFDIDALNFSITAAISDWIPQDAAQPQEQPRAFTSGYAIDHPRLCSTSSDVYGPVQRNWHTRVSRAASPQVPTSEPSDQDLVDDRYREDLSNRLQPRVMNTALPSADFLVSQNTL